MMENELCGNIIQILPLVALYHYFPFREVNAVRLAMHTCLNVPIVIYKIKTFVCLA